MNDEKINFLPFHAINQFMLSDYRLKVLHSVLSSSDQLAPARRSAINSLIRRLVTAPGFRNASLAPVSIKVKGSVAAFERSPEMVAQILSAWYELHPELAAIVHEFLSARGWEILPLDADRSKVPGFLTRWWKDEEFETLDVAFRTARPEYEVSDDDLNLMIVWVSGRLPVEMVERE